MEEILRQTLLYDFYGELLTEHQKQVYEDVVLNDYSLSEVAQSLSISRQGVVDLRGKVGEIHKLTENEKDDPSMQKIGQIAAEILEEL